MGPRLGQSEGHGVRAYRWRRVASPRSERAPHATARLTVQLPPSLRGRRVQFGYRVGGGGGHSLSIKGAVVQLVTAPAPRPISPPQDIRADGFRGFGRRDEDWLPLALVGTYEVR